MRVLLDVSAVPERPVGAGVYTIALARALAERAARADLDVDFDLVLGARRGDAERWRGLGEVLPIVPDARPARLAWEQARAPRVAREHRVDVWHGPHYTLPLRMSAAGVPAVVTVHDLTFFDHPEWHERSKVAFFRHMIRAAAARAAVVVAVSDYTASRLRDLAITGAPIVVAHHGVDHERFSPADPGDDLARLRRHGISPPYIAWTGTFEPRKDVPTLVRAFAAVAERRPDLRLVLAGGRGWGDAAIHAAIASSGTATRVLRPGYLAPDEIPALLRHADVVAYPSLEEGFGLPALEALACGAPLVATTGSAVAEVVGDAALLVAPGSPPALAEALDQASDPEIAARLRAAGPARAATFTWSASAERHVEAYRVACGVRA
jgi:glycosyltransferase involved in cell wall biosynthesis